MNSSTEKKEIPSRLVLASTSVYRRQLLERLGIPFECVSPTCDEDSLKDGSLNPIDLSRSLSELKAKSLGSEFSNAAIIGSDQVCAFQDQCLGKPGSRDAAVKVLQKLQGHSHQLITSTCVLFGGESLVHTNVTTITLRSLSLEQISRYVEKDNPIDCAGSYKIEQMGISLIHSIDTDDETAIIGLPLLSLSATLASLGFVFP